MTTDYIDLDKLEAKLAGTVGITNAGHAERDRDFVKTGALISIARSLESTKVPEHWEALEGPSGAVLGWFDPQVARAIAQALGATEARQATADAEPDDLPLEVGSAVVLTDALSLALDQGDPTLAGIGEVLELGISEGAEWALVKWDDEPDLEPGRVWASHLTVLERREPVSDEARASAEAMATDWIDPAEEESHFDPAVAAELNAEADGEPDLEVNTVTNDGFDIEPDDGAGDPGPEPEVDDDDIDADFDTVVEATPPAVDGLAALKGKSAKRNKG